ncbi:MAG TPA: hypothetical protein VEL75_02390 [Candidatus Methylomirabilis sp.]|nr:hypothetical protein [Candidatus Methylomirabilis sp.]
MPGPEQFRRLPKVELHLHAAGSVRPATMREFVAADGLREALGERYATAAPGEGLPAYLSRFAAWDAAIRGPERMSRVIAELAADLAADGVSYAEVRLRPPTDDDVLWGEMMDAARRAARTRGAPPIGFIGVMLRGWSEDRAMREARRAVACGMVALDVAGDEAIGGLAPLGPAAQLAREGRLAIVAHAGETGGAAAVREVLALIAPARIAHGLGAAEDSSLLAELRARGVHLEMALRSNIQTGTAPDPSRHPFARLLRLGLSVGLSTDNRAISGTTLSEEYALASEALALSAAELARAAVLAAEAAFLPADERRALSRRVRDAWAAGPPR